MSFSLSSTSLLKLRGTHSSHEIAMKIKEAMSGKTLCKDVSKLINDGDKFDGKVFVKNPFMTKVENPLRYATFKNGKQG